MTQKQLVVIKVGGNVIDNEQALTDFLALFAQIEGPKVLIHGGGKIATKMATDLGIAQQMIEGRRVTDADTLRIVTMVYAGLINKNIVAQLQSLGTNAVGMTGADGNLIQAHKRQHTSVDYGFVGDVDAVDTTLLEAVLAKDMAAIVAPITHDKQGQLLNTNADTCAQAIAEVLSAHYQVNLIYCFEKSGVLLDVANDDSVIPVITTNDYAQLKQDGIIFEGMLPKLNAAFGAIHQGVSSVTIGKWQDLPQLTKQTKGTTILL